MTDPLTFVETKPELPHLDEVQTAYFLVSEHITSRVRRRMLRVLLVTLG